MSWDLDVAEARDLAAEQLTAMSPSGDDNWVITAVEERDWGWIISWTNERAVQGSMATRDMYAGGGHFLIDRKTGRVAMCGSAHPIGYYIDAWHRGELTDLPRPA
jgi:Immunity protein 35